jgi:hypothetical protein
MHFKRLLPALLAVIMLFAAIPFAVSAEVVTVTINGFDCYRNSGNLIVYTNAYGDKTNTNEWGVEAVVGADNKVISVGGNNNSIPEGGFVWTVHCDPAADTNAAWLLSFMSSLSAGTMVQFTGVAFANKTASADADALGDEGVQTGSFTYGSEDATYPAEEIKAAASELKDGEVADQVVEANDKYYILNMDAVFDKDATESRKEEIVDERKHELIDSVYDGWIEKETWEADAEALALISLADRTYVAPESTDTEAAEELTVETEEVSTEAVVTVAETEADITAGTEAE